MPEVSGVGALFAKRSSVGRGCSRSEGKSLTPMMGRRLASEAARLEADWAM